ncbi:B12-binding domain-containing protein [Streptomyces sp. LN699]|uniref:cobalamin B12-binding domain-containing protein n=1 Tax=Streptomyces sp. LN699 TaxID=3112981 RepID=UPI00371C724B
MSLMATPSREHRIDHLWEAVCHGEEQAAVDAVFGAPEDGIPAERVLLDLIAPVQRKVGEEWAANHLTVAQEHAASAVNDRVIAALSHCPAAHAAITAVQATGTPVLVGGAAFGRDGQYARLLGADAWAPDASSAADRLDEGPLALPAPAHQPLDDLPHLIDQEYTLVARTRSALVRAVMDALADRFPAMRDDTAAQFEHTAEDIAHIVDFLAIALYTDDPELLTDFLAWTAGILTARGVPAHSLVPAPHILDEQLKDFPRAILMLDQAADPLTGAGSVIASDSRTTV